MTLSSNTIKSIQDIMRKDVGVDGDAQRIGQLAWLLFLKIFDDTEEEQEMMDKKYKPVIPKRFVGPPGRPTRSWQPASTSDSPRDSVRSACPWQRERSEPRWRSSWSTTDP